MAPCRAIRHPSEVFLVNSSVGEGRLEIGLIDNSTCMSIARFIMASFTIKMPKLISITYLGKCNRFIAIDVLSYVLKRKIGRLLRFEASWSSRRNVPEKCDCVGGGGGGGVVVGGGVL